MDTSAARERMRGRGYRATPQRMAVLEALAAEQHQSLDEIRRRCPGVGLVTVYRTLGLLREIGMVQRLDLGDCPRYELAGDHHHHLICEACGRVSGFNKCPLDHERLPKSGFVPHSHSLEVYGKCSACA